jgi:hypothetical protein
MKGILSFNLPEETEDFKLAQDGWKYKAILEEVDNELRKMFKYEDKTTIDITEVRQLINNLTRARLDD